MAQLADDTIAELEAMKTENIHLSSEAVMHDGELQACKLALTKLTDALEVGPSFSLSAERFLLSTSAHLIHACCEHSEENASTLEQEADIVLVTQGILSERIACMHSAQQVCRGRTADADGCMTRCRPPRQILMMRPLMSAVQALHTCCAECMHASTGSVLFSENISAENGLGQDCSFKLETQFMHLCKSHGA